MLTILLLAQTSSSLVMATEMQMHASLVKMVIQEPSVTTSKPCPHHASTSSSQPDAQPQLPATDSCCDGNNAHHCNCCINAASLMPAQYLPPLSQIASGLHAAPLLPALPATLPQRLLRPPRL